MGRVVVFGLLLLILTTTFQSVASSRVHGHRHHQHRWGRRADGVVFLPENDLPPALQVLQGILNEMGIHIDFEKCAGDMEDAYKTVLLAAQAFESKDYVQFVQDLSVALKKFGGGLDDCAIKDIQDAFNVLARQLGLAEIHVYGDIVKVLVAGEDIFDDLATAMQDFNDKNYLAFGADLGKLLKDITPYITCDNIVCKVLDGIFDVIELVAKDYEKCVMEIKDAEPYFTSFVQDFENKDYKSAIDDLSTGLDKMGEALAHGCGLQELADLIQAEAKKLGIANITVIGDVVKILIDDVDIYDDVFQIVKDFENKDYTKAGHDLGDLLRRLQKFSCTSDACILVEGLLEALEIVLSDFEGCEEAVKDIVAEFEKAGADFKAKKYGKAVEALGTAIYDIGAALKTCGLYDLAELVKDVATKIGLGSDVKIIDEIVSVMIGGTELYDDLFDAFEALEKKDYKAFGHAMGDLLNMLEKTGCKTPVCEVVAGILETIEIIAGDLTKCSADFDESWADFEDAVKQFKDKDYKQGLKDMEKAFLLLANAVSDCDVPELATVIINLAKAFGMGHEDVISEIVKILVAGADLYKEIEQIEQDYEAKDWRAMGRDLGELIQTIEIDRGKKCNEEKWCLLATGLLQGLNILTEIKQCLPDLDEAWGEFENATGDFKHKHYKDGVEDLAAGLDDLCHAVTDCQVEEIVDLITKLAAELFGVEISWIEEFVKILVHGVDIYEDCYDAFESYENENWIGFGIDIARLIKMLV